LHIQIYIFVANDGLNVTYVVETCCHFLYDYVTGYTRILIKLYICDNEH